MIEALYRDSIAFVGCLGILGCRVLGLRFCDLEVAAAGVGIQAVRIGVSGCAFRMT